MPYKFNTKLFSLKERHPLGKVRFENANKFIANEMDVSDTKNSAF